MHWPLLIGFIIAHLLAYFVALRYRPLFASERVMLAYHGIAFIAAFSILVIAFVCSAIGFASLCALIALQFIYSISFLELWSLAEGSYSLQILTRLSQHKPTERNKIITMCGEIGVDKKHHRLNNLVAVRLVKRSDDGRLDLSRSGKVLFKSLNIIMRFGAVRDSG